MAPLCPRCFLDLERTRTLGLDATWCPRCHGVWLEWEELRDLLDQAPKPQHAGSPQHQNPLASAVA